MALSASTGTSSSTNIYIHALPPDVTDTHLTQIFGGFGEIESARVIVDLATHKSKGYGFVKFKEPSAAVNAIAAMDGHKIQDKVIVVKAAFESTPNNNIYIKGLPIEVTVAQLKAIFSECGEIAECRILTDSDTQLSRGSALVRFNDVPSASNAVTTFDGKTVPAQGINTPLSVRFADTEEDKALRKSKSRKHLIVQSRFVPYISPATSPYMLPTGAPGYPSPYYHPDSSSQFSPPMVSQYNVRPHSSQGILAPAPLSLSSSGGFYQQHHHPHAHHPHQASLQHQHNSLYGAPPHHSAAAPVSPPSATPQVGPPQANPNPPLLASPPSPYLGHSFGAPRSPLHSSGGYTAPLSASTSVLHPPGGIPNLHQSTTIINPLHHSTGYFPPPPGSSNSNFVNSGFLSRPQTTSPPPGFNSLPNSGALSQSALTGSNGIVKAPADFVDPNVYIYHLPADTNDNLLYQRFARYGLIRSVRVVCDPTTNACKGFGFVRYHTLEAAHAAIAAENGQWMSGKVLAVSLASAKKLGASGGLGASSGVTIVPA